MPHATTDDGVKLHYEETGSGVPVVFVHEFAGDARSWEPQLRHFGQRYRAVAYDARGYPPSDVPPDPASYSQDRAADDIAAVLDHLGLAAAHVVGLSMGGFATLHFGFRHPARALSLTVAGCGYGAEPASRDAFRAVLSQPRPDRILMAAQAIRAGRPERASGELAYHVLDVMVSTAESGLSRTSVDVVSTVELAPALPESWTPADGTFGA